MSKDTVVIGLLGPKLDGTLGPERWNRWRPSVDLFRHDDLLIDRFELLSQPRFSAIAELVSDDIQGVSPATQVNHNPIEFDDAWDFETVYAALFDFASRYAFDPEVERYLLHISTGTHVAQICLFLLAESRRIPAQLVQTSPSPARPGRHGEPGRYRIIDLDLSRYDAIAARHASVRADDLSFLKSGIETRSSAFNALIDQIERVAIGSRAPILLMGPTGAGKTRLARQIFELKRRRGQMQGAFVEVNCATLRGEGAMSALFGHVRGAFTGAIERREGLLRSADGGLLFLDEVGELGLDEQAMLLRAVEEGTFLPVGSDRAERSQFQLIAGTNRDLREEVARGAFREDLLARIDLWTFELPGLAARRDDIEPNLDFELAQWSARTGSHVRFNREARKAFLGFARSPAASWPGNFRDFSASVERMATLAAGGRIDEPLVHEEIQRLERAWRGRGGARRSRASNDLDPLEGLLDADALAQIDPYDRASLREAVETCRRSVSLSDAGRQLFRVSRASKKNPNDADRLRKLLARHGLSWAAVRGSAG